METRHYWIYGGLAVVNMGLAAFGEQLGSGHVPIPPDFAWTVPVLSAVVIGLTMLLPNINQVKGDGPSNGPPAN